MFEYEGQWPGMSVWCKVGSDVGVMGFGAYRAPGKGVMWYGSALQARGAKGMVHHVGCMYVIE